MSSRQNRPGKYYDKTQPRKGEKKPQVFVKALDHPKEDLSQAQESFACRTGIPTTVPRSVVQQVCITPSPKPVSASSLFVPTPIQKPIVVRNNDGKIGWKIYPNQEKECCYTAIELYCYNSDEAKRKFLLIALDRIGRKVIDFFPRGTKDPLFHWKEKTE